MSSAEHRHGRGPAPFLLSDDSSERELPAWPFVHGECRWRRHLHGHPGAGVYRRRYTDYHGFGGLGRDLGRMLRLAAREEEAVAAAGPVGDYADEEESSGCEAEGQSAAEADPPGRPNGQCGRQALI